MKDKNPADMTPGERLQYRITKVGTSQKKIATAFRLSQAAISEFVVGKSKTLRHLYEMTKILGTTYEWIMHFDGPEEIEDVQPKFKRGKVPSNGNIFEQVLPRSHSTPQAFDIESSVPVYGPAFGAASDIVKFTEDFIVDYQPRHPAIVNVRGGFAMIIEGESMTPRKFPGELLYIHPYKEPSIGRDCVVVMEPEGNAVYKLYCGKTKDGNGIKLKQLNPANEFTVSLEKVRKIYAGF